MTLEEFQQFANEQVRKNQEARRREAERKKRLAQWLDEWFSKIHKYEIRSVGGHYEVLKDGRFYCSADTYGEAEKEIPD